MAILQSCPITIIKLHGLLPTVNRPGNSQHLLRGQVRICAPGNILHWQMDANRALLGTSSTGAREEVNSFTYQFAGTSRLSAFPRCHLRCDPIGTNSQTSEMGRFFLNRQLRQSIEKGLTMCQQRSNAPLIILSRAGKCHSASVVRENRHHHGPLHDAFPNS